jgi:type I restriction enzyme S subunit
MADEWPTVLIEDIAEKIAMGPFGSNIKVETFVETGVPVISGAHLRGVRLEDSDFNFVTDEHAERMKNSNVFRGDVIFTHAGNIGQVAYIPPNSQYERYVISQRQFYLRCDLSKAVPAFISYFFHSNEGQHKLLANASQTGVPSIARPSSYLKTIELSLPPLAEQRAIAHILGTLDDKIELNRKQNETLEAMARALFKDWFVDFGPVRAKMEGRDPYLPADLWQLFPDRLEDEGKPKGWDEVAAETVADIGIGKTPPRKEHQWFSEGGKDVRWVSIRDMGDSGVFLQNTSEYLTKEAIEKFNVRVVPDNTVILSFKLTMGRVAITDGEMATNEAIAHLKIGKQSRISTEYLYCYLREFDYGRLGSTSSIATAVNSKSIKAMPVLVPTNDLADLFARRVASIFAHIKHLQSETSTLAQLRDTLLPKLISGKLRIQDAERFLGRAEALDRVETTAK